MDVLDSSHLKAEGVKSPGLKKTFFKLSDTLIRREGIIQIVAYQGGSKANADYDELSPHLHSRGWR